MSTSPRVALLYPPVTDPTSGYHSLSYLDSYARAHGHSGADIVDANIEAFHYSYSPAGLDWLQQHLPAAGRRDYEPDLADDEAKAYLLKVGNPDPRAIRQAVTTLQDRELIYDYGRYQQAVEDVNGWMNCLGATGFPGQFRNGFEAKLPKRFKYGVSGAFADLDALARLSMPFQPYYEDVLLPRLRAGNYDIIGINVTYLAQVPFAAWLARLIKQAAPSAFLIAGGTEVSDIWKYSVNKSLMFKVFPDLDAVVVGEGETAYTTILDSVGAGSLPVGHPNIRLHPKYGPVKPLTVLHYEPLHELPIPDYHGLDWDLYLSPERFVYYSPTRGCYWNKCTFCDYGLNTDGPTSPWRQDHVDTMMRDVRDISTFAKYIYFSVDVLAPATILKFAERVVEEGLDFRWGAEIRLEKYWSDERAQLLRRSGCVAISVGFESGNQRILDLIDKGTKPAQVKQTMTAMHGAGIGVQIMGFTGFPTETLAEARESVDFLVDNRSLWTFGGLGEFQLTSGAIVAKQPDRFGISNLRPLDDSDIVHHLLYDEPISQSVAEEVAQARHTIKPGGHFARPWLGGTDTPHTFFYHDRYGTRLPEVLAAERALSPDDEDRQFVLNGTLLPPQDESLMRAYLDLNGAFTKEVHHDNLVFRRVDGNVFSLPRGLKPFLELFAEPRTLAEARDRAWMIDDTAAAQIWSSMIKPRLIRRVTAELPAVDNLAVAALHQEGSAGPSGLGPATVAV